MSLKIEELLKFKHEEIRDSVSILDSEEMVNKAYDGLLAILSLYPKKEGLAVYRLNHELRSDTERNFDLFTPLITGLYIPGSKRAYWCGHVDVNVDLVVAQGSVYLEPPDHSDYAFVSVVEVAAFPSHIYSGDPAPRHMFKVTTACFFKEMFHRSLGRIGQFSEFFSISQDGSIYQAVDTHKPPRWTFDQYALGPGAINLLADRLFVWNIETEEPNTDFGFPAIVTFGVEAEMVKSLAYARSLPMTESGRKRPILHWVRAHQRRIKDGIDIDVDKSLRGITAFDMGGLQFKITRPVKITNRKGLES